MGVFLVAMVVVTVVFVLSVVVAISPCSSSLWL
jgi:hypothetical protein